jgi:GntP family gluconate:H+ symporter
MLVGWLEPVAKALVASSIAAGAMVVSHANDSFFWVVTQMAKMDIKTGYKVHTLATLIIGITSGLTVWGISLIIL